MLRNTSATFHYIYRKVPRPHQLPLIALAVLACVILVGVGWSPANVNALGTLFAFCTEGEEVFGTDGFRQFRVIEGSATERVLGYARIHWTQVLCVSLSGWMFGGFLGDWVSTLKGIGSAACALLSPLCFLCAILCLLYLSDERAHFLGALLLGLAFHFVYRYASNSCLLYDDTRRVVLCILLLAATADLSGALPVIVLLRAVNTGARGSALRAVTLKWASVIAAVAVAIGIGVLPGMREPEPVGDVETTGSDYSIAVTDIDSRDASENIPFLSFDPSKPLPPLTVYREGPRASICYLGYLPPVSDLTEIALNTREKDTEWLVTIYGFIEWILQLFNTFATTHATCWISRGFPELLFPVNGFYLSDFLHLFAWLFGVLLFLSWARYGSLTFRRVQCGALIGVLCLLSVAHAICRIAATFLFLFSRSATYGSVDFAVEYLQRWHIKRKGLPRLKSPHPVLIPLIHLAIAPYAEAVLIAGWADTEPARQRLKFFHFALAALGCVLLVGSFGLESLAKGSVGFDIKSIQRRYRIWCPDTNGL